MRVPGLDVRKTLSLVTLGISYLGTKAVETRLRNATPDLSTVVREEAIGEIGETPVRGATPYLATKSIEI